ncbi:hypothetical protein ACLKA6_007329 [Drosophila palustris]
MPLSFHTPIRIPIILETIDVRQFGNHYCDLSRFHWHHCRRQHHRPWPRERQPLSLRRWSRLDRDSAEYVLTLADIAHEWGRD